MVDLMKSDDRFIRSTYKISYGKERQKTLFCHVFMNDQEYPNGSGDSQETGHSLDTSPFMTEPIPDIRNTTSSQDSSDSPFLTGPISQIRDSSTDTDSDTDASQNPFMTEPIPELRNTVPADDSSQDPFTTGPIPEFGSVPPGNSNNGQTPPPFQNPPEKRPEKKKDRTMVAGLLGGLIGALAMLIIFVCLYNFTDLFKTGSTTYTSTGGQTITIDTSNINSEIEAVAAIVPQSVVGVYTEGVETTTSYFGRETSTEFAATGSGFIVTTDGYIVTNQHVVSDNPTKIQIYLEDDSVYDAQVIWSDSSLDMAVLKIDATGLPAVTLGDSSDVNVGETVVAIGNPLGLSFSRTVTSGIVSAVDRSLVVNSTLVAEDLIQTDAAINSGNSGGPLVNMEGQVIGINTYKSSTGEGIGFALPINILKPILNDIIETGSFNPVTIGINGYDSQTAYYLVPDSDLKEGIYVSSVTDNSPAAQAGIKAGDVILKADGTEVNTMLKLKEIIYGKHSGDTITLTVESDGSTRDVTLTL